MSSTRGGDVPNWKELTNAYNSLGQLVQPQKTASDQEFREKLNYFGQIKKQISTICKDQDTSTHSDNVFGNIDFSRLSAQQLTQLADITRLLQSQPRPNH